MKEIVEVHTFLVSFVRFLPAAMTFSSSMMTQLVSGKLNIS